MTRRDLSAATVVARLDLLDELLDDLRSLGQLTAAELEERRIERRATERILSQLVEVASDVNQHVASTVGGRVASEYRESFDVAARVGLITPELAAQIKPSVGLRNVITREYANIDLAKLAAAIPLALEQYTEYRRSVARWLAARPDGAHE